MKNKNGQLSIIVAVVVVVLIAGFFYLQTNSEDTNHINDDTHTHDSEENVVNEQTSASDEETIESTSPVVSQETKEFDVIAKQWDFSPNTITVNQGDKVVLNVESIDVNHGIAIPDFGVNEFLSPGNTVKLEFTADKKGTFSFFCNVFCGSGHGGMKGTLVVK